MFMRIWKKPENLENLSKILAQYSSNFVTVCKKLCRVTLVKIVCCEFAERDALIATYNDYEKGLA